MEGVTNAKYNGLVTAPYNGAPDTNIMIELWLSGSAESGSGELAWQTVWGVSDNFVFAPAVRYVHNFQLDLNSIGHIYTYPPQETGGQYPGQSGSPANSPIGAELVLH